MMQPTIRIENFRNLVVRVVNHLNSKCKRFSRNPICPNSSQTYRLLARPCENRATFIAKLQITPIWIPFWIKKFEWGALKLVIRIICNSDYSAKKIGAESGALAISIELAKLRAIWRVNVNEFYLNEILIYMLSFNLNGVLLIFRYIIFNYAIWV